MHRLTKQELKMSALKTYLVRKNAYGTIFGAKELTLDNATDRQRIADSIDSDLSLIEEEEGNENTARISSGLEE
jgi:hypothetical protein